MTPEEKALRDAFLAECWKPCREVSREERAVEKALAESRGKAVDKAQRRAS